MSQPGKRRKATVADLLAIPEEARRHEIIDGVLVQKEAATGAHKADYSGASVRTIVVPEVAGRAAGGSRRRWRCSSRNTRFFVPDVTGWRRERLPELPKTVPITVIPDWICEILSTNRRNDLVRKKRIYHRHRVGHYWLIDPDEETLSVLRWSADGYVEVLNAERSEVLRAEPFDMDLPIRVLFGEDEEE